MKILWLTETPSKYKPEEFGYNGRGWIESLQSLLEKSTEIEQLGIAFPHSIDSEKLTQGKVVYYPIKRVMPGNIVSWIISNWQNKIEHENEINSLKAIVEDFEPDVIHIFGTESWLCHAVTMTNKPCIVHLQGLLLPYLNAFTPVGISKFDLMTSNWIEFIKGISLWHHQRVFDKKSKREYKFFKEISFFMGRTKWDKSISGFLSPGSIYFHVDEVLRDKFYTAVPWKQNKTNKVILTSTLSDALYKGLDMVIKTASILIKEKFDFEWRVIGVNKESKTARLLNRVYKSKYPDLNISLLGLGTAEEIIGLLGETTFYIHPSSIDNSPNSLCEAQILGVPIIATNVGGVSSLIEDGKNGFLVPANDPYLMASRIVQLSHNQDLMRNIGERARENAQKRHSKETILNQLINTYKDVTIGYTKRERSSVKNVSSILNI